ncbi:MAG TPA: hypothetical protein VGZ02_16080 [Candidatus Baltobacteraceae bacterium]|nr:hypothetical protein [Candidatus Baltobacteraceae bacterium]
MATSGVVAYAVLLLHAVSVKNSLLAVVAIVMICWACAYPLIWSMTTPLAVAGGFLLACAIVSLGFFLAQLAGVKPFEDDRASY